MKIVVLKLCFKIVRYHRYKGVHQRNPQIVMILVYKTVKGEAPAIM